jgi:hypothetical protein
MPFWFLLENLFRVLALMSKLVTFHIDEAWKTEFSLS